MKIRHRIRSMCAFVLMLVAFSYIFSFSYVDARENMQSHRHMRQRWEELSETEKEQMRETLDKWRAMPQEKREEFKKRIRAFQSLSEEEQHKVRNRWEEYKNLSSEERSQLRERFQKWRNMPQEKRKDMRGKLRRWKMLSPEERSKLRRRVHALRQNETFPMAHGENRYRHSDEHAIHEDDYNRLRGSRMFYEQRERSPRASQASRYPVGGRRLDGRRVR